MAKSGPFDCVLAKRLQSVKWKLKKASAQNGQGRPGRPEAECQDQEKRKRKKHQKRERPAVPGTVEFD